MHTLRERVRNMRSSTALLQALEPVSHACRCALDCDDPVGRLGEGRAYVFGAGEVVQGGRALTEDAENYQGGVNGHRDLRVEFADGAES